MDAGRVWVRVGDAIKLREDGARIHRQVPTNYFPFKVRHATAATETLTVRLSRADSTGPALVPR